MRAERLTVNDVDYEIRSARIEDVPAIVALLSDDVLGRHREADAAEAAPYLRAFELMQEHANQELIVVTRGDTIVATLDLATLPSLSRRGTVRLQVEAVRVASAARGSGLGSALFDWIVAYARQRRCTLVQLTSDRSRAEAHAFYERLGFVASHTGYKLDLS